VTGAAVLLGSDVFQFSWRYQLPALVTLPPAGALGLSVIAGYVTARRRRPAGPQLPRQAVPAAGDPGEAGAAGPGGQPAAGDVGGRNEALGV
jgi:MYXO-CTERM domain-containing protein